MFLSGLVFISQIFSCLQVAETVKALAWLMSSLGEKPSVGSTAATPHCCRGLEEGGRRSRGSTRSLSLLGGWLLSSLHSEKINTCNKLPTLMDWVHCLPEAVPFLKASWGLQRC